MKFIPACSRQYCRQYCRQSIILLLLSGLMLLLLQLIPQPLNASDDSSAALAAAAAVAAAAEDNAETNEQPQLPKIGVFFGTFDPPHVNHVLVALKCAEFLELDRVYMIPNYEPRKKPLASGFSDRYNMIGLINQQHREIVTLKPETIEKIYQLDPDNYISGLLEEIRRREKNTPGLYHLCGTDSFNKMAEINRLPAADEDRIVAVIDRKGYEPELTDLVRKLEQQGKIVFIKVDLPELSSTAIRSYFFAGEVPPQELLDPEISDYVIRHRLYGFPEPESDSESDLSLISF